MTDYESALGFREFLYFQNVPIIHGRYEADQKFCSSPQHFKTGQLRNLAPTDHTLKYIDGMFMMNLHKTLQVEVHFPKGKLPNLSDDSEVKTKKSKTLSVEAKKKKLEAAQKDVNNMEARIEEIKQTWREQELVRLVYFYQPGLVEVNALVGPQESCWPHP